MFERAKEIIRAFKNEPASDSWPSIPKSIVSIRGLRREVVGRILTDDVFDEIVWVANGEQEKLDKVFNEWLTED